MMVTSSNIDVRRRIGDQAEEMLIQMLKEKGFEARRLSQSPLGRRRYPDVVACKGDRWYAFEVKSLEAKNQRVIKDKTVKIHPHVTIKKRQLARCFQYLRNRRLQVGGVYVATLFKREDGQSKWVFQRVSDARRDVRVSE